MHFVQVQGDTQGVVQGDTDGERLPNPPWQGLGNIGHSMPGSGGAREEAMHPTGMAATGTCQALSIVLSAIDDRSHLRSPHPSNPPSTRCRCSLHRQRV